MHDETRMEEAESGGEWGKEEWCEGVELSGGREEWREGMEESGERKSGVRGGGEWGKCGVV